MPNYYKSDSGFVMTVPGAISVTDLTVVDDLTVGDALAVTGISTLTGSVGLGANADLTMAAGGQVVLDPGTTAAPGLAFSNNLTKGLSGNSGANLLNIVVDSSIHQQIGFSSNTIVTPTLTGVVSVSGHISMAEVAAPAAVADRALLYGEDVGGKTAARAKVGTAGTVGTIAVEP